MHRKPGRASLSLVAAALLATGCAGIAPDRGEMPAATNVILFIGDGMGVSTVTATRIYDGQSRGESGEENVLSFERFPNLALVKTYNVNQQVPDSAGTATAIHTGNKTRAGVIGIGPEAKRRDCAAARDTELTTIADRVRERGMDFGIVTTTRLTHATPATLFAHSPERDWESDEFLGGRERAAGCVDIARQFAEMPEASGPAIALGGGWREFMPTTLGGKRRDGADLINAWLDSAPGRQYITASAELAGLDPNGQVLGLFSRSHMSFEAERDPNSTEPGIVQMTAAAIDFLEGRGHGYFLLVEGGRIDHGHHQGQPGLALTEAQAFANAVQAAVDRVDLDETLVIVTADHSHVFTLAGYPTRGNDILGLVVGNDLAGEPLNYPTLAADGQPYTSVGYANGRNAIQGPRPAPDTGLMAVAQSLVPIQYTAIDGEVGHDETHGGEDVAVYAIGPGSDAVRGVIEQDRLFDIMLKAYGID
jgi:alkaline phosphatase